MGDDYYLSMFNCEPARADQHQYLMGSTGEDQASFYLFKSVLEKGHYNIYVQALITLSEEDLYYFREIRKRENRRQFERFMNGISLGVLYSEHNP